ECVQLDTLGRVIRVVSARGQHRIVAGDRSPALVVTSGEIGRGSADRSRINSGWLADPAIVRPGRRGGLLRDDSCRSRTRSARTRVICRRARDEQCGDRTGRAGDNKRTTHPASEESERRCWRARTCGLPNVRTSLPMVQFRPAPCSLSSVTLEWRRPMPSWSNKDERKYEDIKEGYEKRGKDEDTAEEIAARTVNKGRREEGRTPNSRTEGTGNPRHGLESRSKDELENRAKELHVKGASGDTKEELVRAIRKKEE